MPAPSFESPRPQDRARRAGKAARPHRGRRVAAVAGMALAFGAAGAAVDARAATVGPQATLRPPSAQPIDFPGRRYDKGAPIPRGHVVLRRKVAMEPREAPRKVTFLCPRGTFAITPGQPEGSEVFMVIDATQYDSPRRRFVVQARPAPPAFIDGPTASGSLYLLCGPRRFVATR